jgi:hypothetical protein
MFIHALPIDLSTYEKHIYSQNGEDGVIDAIFDHIGLTNAYFVEFGVENGAECNTRFLRAEQGWRGLMMDGSHGNPAINLHKEFITAENIQSLFEKYNVPETFDLLSIDIDRNDFYVWHAIDKYHPRVVVIEYNASHLPDEDKVCIYDPQAMWDLTNYFGASHLAYARLGRAKGYTLVYAENRGTNLFFIRDDVLASFGIEFKDQGNVNALYKLPRYGKGPRGHMPDPQNRPYSSSEEAMKRSKP